MAHRIVIDRLKCETNGYCMMTAKGLIRQAKDGSPVVDSDLLDSSQVEIAKLAAKACPMTAIHIEEIQLDRDG